MTKSRISRGGTPTANTMRYDRAPQSLDSQTNYMLAAYMPSGT